MIATKESFSHLSIESCDAKMSEFCLLLALSFRHLGNQRISCSCCGTVTMLSEIEPIVATYGEQILVARVCQNCVGAVKATSGSNIQSFLSFAMGQVEQMLLSSAAWLDFALLRDNNNQPFIRRPTFAEDQEAQATGLLFAGNSVVVVAPHGEKQLSRRLMPFPFPWRDEQEWWDGPIAAKGAVDLADAIKRDEVEALIIGTSALFSTSTETMGSLMRS